MSDHAANQERGLKAALSNPNVSDQAKDGVQAKLDEIHQVQSTTGNGTATDGDEHEHRVAGGLKAATHNPNVTEEGKAAAQAKLEQLNSGNGIGVASASAGAADDGDEHAHRVAGGLKAAINNPNVTAEGKKAAEEKLEMLKG